jgi:hypothetical protein
MKLRTFNISLLCVAVAAAAMLLKLTIDFGVLRTGFLLLPFAGPLVGVSLCGRGWGNRIAGGLLGGIFAGMIWCTIIGVTVWIPEHRYSYLQVIVVSSLIIMVYMTIGLLIGGLWWICSASDADLSAATSEEK